MGFWSKLFGGQKEGPHIEKRTLLNLRLDDIVTYDLVDYIIVGLIRYNDSGYEWLAYQMEGEGKRLWLAVEQDDTLEVGIYRTVNLELGLNPPARVEYKGKVFYLDESGSAVITAVSGEAGAIVGQHIRYWDYEDEQEDYTLSVELWGGDLEVSYGYYIHPRELTILAGS